MSIIPQSRPGDIERSRWVWTPEKLEGKIVSLDELKNLFHETPELAVIDILEDKKGYVVYGRKFKKFSFPEGQREAYKCKSCNNLIIGSPVINDDTSIKDGVPLSGREGFDVSCGKCYSHLDDTTFMQS